MDYAAWSRWYDLFYSTAAHDEIDFYLDLMRAAGGPVLEIGVGTGRIAVPAAMQGVEVTGIDFSREMLAVAERKARASAPLSGTLTLVQADMRSLELQRRDFSLVTIPSRTLLLATTYQDQFRTLCCAARRLRPGGMLALDVFFPSPELLADDTGEPIVLGEVTDPASAKRYRLSAVNRFDTASQLNHGIQIAEEMDSAGRTTDRIELDVALRYLLPHELFSLMDEAGLEVHEVYGGFDRSPLTEQSTDMIFIARLAE
jgi:ubiquinone/menaquinone biosynthesis C-methylase UbiE